MKTLLHFFSCGLFAVSMTPCMAGTLVSSWTGNQAIPDNNASGVSYSFLMNPGTPQTITGVSVELSVAGGWDGDLYLYLSHGSGFSVLLNRIGGTAANPDGSSSAGLNVSLSDNAASDIHLFNGSLLTGNFAPDGRDVNPFTTLDTDARLAMLGTLTGLDVGGTWTLFFADLSPLAISTVQGWTVTVDTTAVPEPGVGMFTGFSVLVGVGLRKRILQNEFAVFSAHAG